MHLPILNSVMGYTITVISLSGYVGYIVTVILLVVKVTDVYDRMSATQRLQ